MYGKGRPTPKTSGVSAGNTRLLNRTSISASSSAVASG